MADPASSPATLEPNPLHFESGAPNTLNNQPDPVPPSSPPSTQSQSSTPSSTPVPINPNPNPELASAPLPPPPPPTISYAAAVGPPQVSGVSAVVFPPSMPSFRPLPRQAPQFSPLPSPGGAPNLNYQNPAVPPPAVASAAAAVSVPVPQMQPMMSYQVPPGQPANPALRPFAPMPNGYAGPQGTIAPAVS